MQPETAEGSAALPPRRGKRLSAIPITVGYRLHSDLFEEITRLEDYYPTRAETAILRAR